MWLYLLLAPPVLYLLHVLVLQPYLLYRTFTPHVPHLTFIPFIGHALHFVYGFLLGQPNLFSQQNLSPANRHHTFLWSLLVYPMLSTCDPTVVQQVLRSKYDYYEKGFISTTPARPLMGDHNVLTLDEPEHARSRRMVMSAFHAQSVTAMFPLMRTLTVEHIGRLKAALAAGESSEVDLKAEFTELTFTILTACAFGSSLASLPRAHRVLHHTFHTLLAAQNVRNLTFINNLPLLRHLPILYKPTIDAGRADVEALVADIIHHRRSGQSQSMIGDGSSDLLDVLLAATDDSGVGFTEAEVTSQSLAFIFAGHETTAGLLSWLFGELATRPELYERLRREVEEVTGGGELQADHITRLPVVDAAINEALRLWPPAPYLFRRCIRPHTLTLQSSSQPLHMPAGMWVCLDMYAMHRMPQWWGEQSNEFVVDRWLGGSSGNGGGKSGGRAYLPFSVGVRSCVGQVFAMQEARVVMCEMVRAFGMWRDVRKPLWEEIRVSYSPHAVKVNLSSHGPKTVD